MKSLSIVLVVGAALLVLASCGSDQPAARPDRPAAVPAEPAGSLDRPTGARLIRCPTAGETLKYDAEFSPGQASNAVDTLQVTFREKKPTSAEAEAVLRRCIEAAGRSLRIDYETLVNAWFNDDGPLPLTDGSTSLAYDPKTSSIQTWNERQGEKPVQSKRKGYTVEYQENKVLVPPYGKFATIDVLFQQPPEQDEILKILVAEVGKAVREQSTKLNTTAFAKSGPIKDPAAQKQIRGTRSNRYLQVEFDADSGRTRDQDGMVLQMVKRVVP